MFEVNIEFVMLTVSTQEVYMAPPSNHAMFEVKFVLSMVKGPAS